MLHVQTHPSRIIQHTRLTIVSRIKNYIALTIWLILIFHLKISFRTTIAMLSRASAKILGALAFTHIQFTILLHW